MDLMQNTPMESHRIYINMLEVEKRVSNLFYSAFFYPYVSNDSLIKYNIITYSTVENV